MSPRPLRPLALPLLSLMLAAAPSRAGAQAVPALAAGDLIRIQSADGGGTFRFVGVSVAGDTIVARRHRRQEIERFPVASIVRLERSAGTKSRLGGFGRGLAIGGLTGIAVGGTIGLVAAATDDDDSGDYIISDEAAAAILAVAGGVSFGVIGGVIGAALPGRRWESLPVASRLSLQPMHGGLGVRLAF